MPPKSRGPNRSLPLKNIYLDSARTLPLVAVQLSEDEPTIWCKLEFLNPSGSTKDRIATYILEKAWRQGDVKAGSTVVEASSGSTSIAMALVCAQLGLKFIAVMPEGVSKERSMIVRSYGGEVVFSPKAEGIVGACDAAERFESERGAYFPRQFENIDNAAAHRFGTAREILEQIPGGDVSAVVSGVGTGGTLVGLDQGFQDHGCMASTFAARPIMTDDSPRSGFADAECCSFSQSIPGVVENMSKLYRPEEMQAHQEIDVDDKVALETARRLIRLGFPVGPSSGLNFAAAVAIAQDIGVEGAIVTVFPDRMERYFSTSLFESGPVESGPVESGPVE